MLDGTMQHFTSSQHTESKPLVLQVSTSENVQFRHESVLDLTCIEHLPRYTDLHNLDRETRSDFGRAHTRTGNPVWKQMTSKIWNQNKSYFLPRPRTPNRTCSNARSLAIPLRYSRLVTEARCIQARLCSGSLALRAATVESRYFSA